MSIPYVIEQTPRGERQYDIYSRLLKDRIIFIGQPIDDYYCNIIIAQLLFLDAEDSETDIYLYINSPGGYITSGLAIYDTMQYIKAEIRTICVGQASNISSLLLAAGTKGKRSALPNARIVMHQPLGGVSGQSKDIELQAKEILDIKDRLNQIYALHTGKPLEQIERDTDRLFYMTAHQAKDYGIIDNVIEPNVEKLKKLQLESTK
ncbi:MAG: ATP-dependent Clp protease proteolytic subunit [Leptospiraceae bacterium]|nr:MAG: ATP-dependent Clp protease proteolytic subunit [Leptospiraceae bacterium]